MKVIHWNLVEMPRRASCYPFFFSFQRKTEECSLVVGYLICMDKGLGSIPQYHVNKPTSITKIPHHISTELKV